MATRETDRILVLHWGRTGGGPKFTLDMARGLAKLPQLEVYGSVSRYADNFDQWRVLDERLHSVQTYRNGREFITGIFRWVAAIVSFRKFVRENDIGVVYSGMLSLWQSLALPVLIPRGVMYVSSIHDAQEHPGDESLLLRLARRNELKRARLVVGYSSHACDELGGQVGPGTTVRELRLGVEVFATAPRRLAAQDGITVGFFGRIVAYKGLEIFVESIARLQAAGISVSGLVCGAGRVDSELVESSKDFIDWQLGWVDPAEVDSIFDRIDILALPYTEASQSAVLTQAAGFAIPVVATPVGGLRQQVLESRCGILSERVDAESFAEAVRLLASSPAQYEALSDNAMSLANSRLSWSSVAFDLMQAIEECR